MSIRCIIKHSILCLVILVNALVIVPFAEASVKEETVFLPTRPGVVQPFIVSYDDATQPEAIAILFAGSSGNIGINQNGQPITNENFLVRSRQIFVQNHLATVIIDCPSDRKDGMDTAFRISNDHAMDVGLVVDEMNKKFPGLPVYLIGTSRGTISAASVAKKLEGKVNGVVLTSAVFNEIDFSKPFIVPVLIVHNTEDGCPASPYSGAINTSKSYGYPLVSVKGGSVATGRAACGSFSPHGFLNKEEPTISTIANWIFERPYKTDL